MNPSTYIPIVLLWIIIFISFRNRRKAVIASKIIEKRDMGVNEMKALAERFIEKECIIYAFDSRQFEGVIKEVADGAILVEKDGKLEAINLNFIIRIREYPRNKKGNKKSLVLD